jgi:hypothetical protein
MKRNCSANALEAAFETGFFSFSENFDNRRLNRPILLSLISFR